MATSEENQELIETIKRPIRYYRIHLWGYGGESAYLGITKEQYEFWKDKDEEDFDTTMSYMNEAQDEGKPDWVPEEMDFMKDSDGDYRPWYESPTEFCHQYGVEVGSARLTIDEIESDEYSAKSLETVVDGVELQEYLNNIDEEHDWELELVRMGVAEGTDEQPDYVLQFYSAEKGTFFEGIFASRGTFDPKKLIVYTEEFPNGEDIVVNMTYDNEDIENQGGDTNGKGYSTHMWSNVQ